MKAAPAILRLLAGRNLTLSESQTLFLQIFKQRIPEKEIKALLLLLAKKGETAPEVIGCLNALQSLEKISRPPVPGLMDTCGTGGDEKHSLNISTLAALVIAGAGGKISLNSIIWLVIKPINSRVRALMVFFPVNSLIKLKSV